MPKSAAPEGKVKKSYNLDQSIIDEAKAALGVTTETEAIEMALRLVSYGHHAADGTAESLGEAYHDELGLVGEPE